MSDDEGFDPLERDLDEGGVPIDRNESEAHADRSPSPVNYLDTAASPQRPITPPVEMDAVPRPPPAAAAAAASSVPLKRKTRAPSAPAPPSSLKPQRSPTSPANRERMNKMLGTLRSDLAFDKMWISYCEELARPEVLKQGRIKDVAEMNALKKHDVQWLTRVAAGTWQTMELSQQARSEANERLSSTMRLIKIYGEQFKLRMKKQEESIQSAMEKLMDLQGGAEEVKRRNEWLKEHPIALWPQESRWLLSYHFPAYDWSLGVTKSQPAAASSSASSSSAAAAAAAEATPSKKARTEIIAQADAGLSLKHLRGKSLCSKPDVSSVRCFARSSPTPSPATTSTLAPMSSAAAPFVSPFE